MKTLNRKLHSQRGASILLALLFLLACMMVAASVLMAAASNAGKIRSNYEEQQRCAPFALFSSTVLVFRFTLFQSISWSWAMDRTP